MALFVIVALIAWSILAVVGVERGLYRRLVVFRGWGDVALTAALIVAAALWLVSLRQPAEAAHAFLAALLLLLAPWLLLTKTANRRWLSLGLSIPAKLTLVLLTLLATALALSSAVSALSRKSDARTRGTNAAIAAGAAAAAGCLFRTIRRLASGAAFPAKSSNRYFSKVAAA